MVHAHNEVHQTIMNHYISLGYQHRSLVPEEKFSSPHCSSMQYGQVYAFHTTEEIGFFTNPSITIVGLNQSVIQPSASLVIGFQFGSHLQIGSGPIVHFREEEDEPFLPQLVLQATYIFKYNGASLPFTFGYVPLSKSLTQAQILIGYTWAPKSKK